MYLIKIESPRSSFSNPIFKQIWSNQSICLCCYVLFE